MFDWLCVRTPNGRYADRLYWQPCYTAKQWHQWSSTRLDHIVPVQSVTAGVLQGTPVLSFGSLSCSMSLPSAVSQVMCMPTTHSTPAVTVMKQCIVWRRASHGFVTGWPAIAWNLMKIRHRLSGWVPISNSTKSWSQILICQTPWFHYPLLWTTLAFSWTVNWPWPTRLLHSAGPVSFICEYSGWLSSHWLQRQPAYSFRLLSAVDWIAATAYWLVLAINC